MPVRKDMRYQWGTLQSVTHYELAEKIKHAIGAPVKDNDVLYALHYNLMYYGEYVKLVDVTPEWLEWPEDCTVTCNKQGAIRYKGKDKPIYHGVVHINARSWRVGKIVAETWLVNEEGTHLRHRNGNYYDESAANLYWSKNRATYYYRTPDGTFTSVRQVAIHYGVKPDKVQNVINNGTLLDGVLITKHEVTE